VCTWVFQAQPLCAHRQKIIFMRTHTTVANIARVHPPTSGENKNSRVNSPKFGILQDICLLEREGA
jgi:hypothetical protein